MNGSLLMISGVISSSSIVFFFSSSLLLLSGKSLQRGKIAPRVMCIYTVYLCSSETPLANSTKRQGGPRKNRRPDVLRTGALGSVSHHRIGNHADHHLRRVKNMVASLF